MNDSSSQGLIVFLTFVIIVLISQLVSINKKIDVYKSCLSKYEAKEKEYIDVIEWSYDYLVSGGSQNYRNAVDELNINTNRIYCSVP